MSPVATKSWLPLAFHRWDRPSGWLIVRLHPECRVWHAVHVLATRNETHPSRFYCFTKMCLWICCLWSFLGPALMVFEAVHWMCFFWGLLGRTLVQANVRYCLWLARGKLFRATTWSTIVAASAEPMCAWEEQSCEPRPASTCTKQVQQRNRSAKGPRHWDLSLPTGCQFGFVTEKASGNARVAWSRLSVCH